MNAEMSHKNCMCAQIQPCVAKSRGEQLGRRNAGRLEGGEWQVGRGRAGVCV